MFSVVIPLYNKELSVKNTLTSVLRQTFSEFEIVIVNDGSTDNSLEIVKQIKDDRIRIINQPNGGVSSARNRGIKEARYEWIAFLDADDLWDVSKLSKLSIVISCNPHIHWIIHGYVMNSINKSIDMVYSDSGELEDVVSDLNEGLMIQTSAVAVKKQSLIQNQILFRVGLNRSEDREVWYKLSLLYPSPYYLNEILSHYIIDSRNNSLTADQTNISIDFITLEDRLTEELSRVNESRKQEFLVFLNRITKHQILKIWTKMKDWDPSFNRYFNEVEQKFLLFFIRFPELLKRAIRKLFFY